ncbi:MAG: S-methyl-5-thioribose-1-phosphate isomerase [Candidatus Kapabacteria bacterium]|nr:S-methyl-5-thioribose-1-phosphate isomerase [Candidatus Kapabacteria bacterium]MDW8011815.1 S-methyl-5-thioribose-1-phosphate isomerase [Bacteroidota bacterium]
MIVNGVPYRTIWRQREGVIALIDQRFLPHRFVVEEVHTVEEMARAIREMHIRGAIALGAAAAYGLELAAVSAPDDQLRKALQRAATVLRQTRPTAVNIAWAVATVMAAVDGVEQPQELRFRLLQVVDALVEAEVDRCRRIGEHGARLLQQLAEQRGGKPLNILTHCNAGWLGCVDYGTALAPVYVAAEAGTPLHVWVSETRPRNQGAALTAWELQQQGIPYTIVVDSACGHLVQRGMVDVAIVGADRISRRGDTANKIGTYLKALACHRYGVPFYVAAPSSSVDWGLSDGLQAIPIEERSPDEVLTTSGWDGNGIATVRIAPEGAPAWNPAFDVTPAELITGFITEHGVIQPTEAALEALARNADVRVGGDR